MYLPNWRRLQRSRNDLTVIRLPGGLSFPTSTGKEFNIAIICNIEAVHFVSALTNAAKFKTDKKIGKLARELIKALKASDEKQLSHFLPHGSTVGAHIAALDDLADAARSISRLKKAPRLGKAEIVSRHGFVERLLDAAHSAGGRLTLNRRGERGSLIDAIELLAPYLPAETASKLSFATVRRIREAWLKKQENRSKILLN
jgi:hypothetical protein